MSAADMSTVVNTLRPNDTLYETDNLLTMPAVNTTVQTTSAVVDETSPNVVNITQMILSWNSTLVVVESSQSDNTTSINVGYAFFFMLAFLFICGANLLVILAMHRTEGVHSVTKIFITNLAITDFSFGALAIHKFIFELNPGLIEDYWACLVKIFITIVSYEASVTTLIGK